GSAESGSDEFQLKGSDEFQLKGVQRMGMRYWQVAATVVALAMLAGGGEAHAADLDCHLRFTMKGWSVFYKTASGTGTVHCNNGQSMNVKLSAKGGGLTVG